MRKRYISLVVLILVGLSLLFGATWVSIETQFPSLAEFQSIQPNMHRQQVVKELGVLYDDYSPGQYPDVDRTIAQMDNNQRITKVARWPIAFSPSCCWVAWDKDDRVVSTKLQTP